MCFVEQKMTRRGRKSRAKTDEMFEYQEEKVVSRESQSLLSLFIPKFLPKQCLQLEWCYDTKSLISLHFG